MDLPYLSLLSCLDSCSSAGFRYYNPARFFFKVKLFFLREKFAFQQKCDIFTKIFRIGLSELFRGFGRRVEYRDQIPAPFFRVLIPLFRKIVLRGSSPGPVFNAHICANHKEGIYA